MPSSTTTDRVPLAVWRLGHPSPDTAASMRRQLADRILDTYGRGAAFVADARGDADHFSIDRAATGTDVVAFDLGSDDHDRLAGSIDLIVALPGDSSLEPLRPFAIPVGLCAVLAKEASECLRPGGYLIVGSISGPGVDPITSTVAAAAKAGLSYFQHVVVLAASVTSATPLSIGRCPRRPGHIDLLVFEKGGA